MRIEKPNRVLLFNLKKKKKVEVVFNFFLIYAFLYIFFIYVVVIHMKRFQMVFPVSYPPPIFFKTRFYYNSAAYITYIVGLLDMYRQTSIQRILHPLLG